MPVSLADVTRTSKYAYGLHTSIQNEKV